MTKAQLTENIRKKKSYLCVGLDTDIERLPDGIAKNPAGMLEFNRRIIEATHSYAVAYKINTAFYEHLGAEGWDVMQRTLEYIPSNIFTIADAKRGDIGNTSHHYAAAFFQTLPFDAITVNPYMGEDSIKPFYLEGKWVIILGLTSNPGADDFQMQRLTNEDKYVFEKVIEVSRHWGNEDNTMYVVGATRGEYITRVRKIIPQHFLLIPGVGTQGGNLKEVITRARNQTEGILINVSRDIIYKNASSCFDRVAREQAEKYCYAMADFFGES